MLPAASRRKRLLLLLGLLCLAIRYLLRRRRRLRAEAPLEPLPATKRVSSSRDAAPQVADPGGRKLLTLQVSIAKLKVRNLPAGPQGSWPLEAVRQLQHLVLGSTSPPAPPLRLSLAWGGREMLRSGVGKSTSAGSSTRWEDRLVFDHVTTAERLHAQRLDISMHGEGPQPVGLLSLGLEELARGPTPNDHPLAGADGRPTGARFAFRCRISELRQWRMRLQQVRLTLHPSMLDALDADAQGPPRAYVFTLSYVFTSGSTGASSGEDTYRAQRTRLVLPARAAEVALEWGGERAGESGVAGGEEGARGAAGAAGGAEGAAGGATGAAERELPDVMHRGAFWEVSAAAATGHEGGGWGGRGGGWGGRGGRGGEGEKGREGRSGGVWAGEGAGGAGERAWGFGTRGRSERARSSACACVVRLPAPASRLRPPPTFGLGSSALPRRCATARCSCTSAGAATRPSPRPPHTRGAPRAALPRQARPRARQTCRLTSRRSRSWWRRAR